LSTLITNKQATKRNYIFRTLIHSIGLKWGDTMRGFNGIFCALLIFMVAARVAGQSSYVFHHLTTEDGLSNSNVTGILRDSYGFLWIGTESGLNRYDGYGYKVYTAKTGVSNTISLNSSWGLQEDG